MKFHLTFIGSVTLVLVAMPSIAQLEPPTLTMDAGGPARCLYINDPAKGGADRRIQLGCIDPAVNAFRFDPSNVTWRSSLVSRPVYAGSENSIETAFKGDFSKVRIAAPFSITGASTLGQPRSGYQYQPNTSPFVTYLYSSSGWNQSTAGNDGRTIAIAYRTKVVNVGQGDMAAYNCSGYVAGQRPGATNFLANPAVSCMNGEFVAGNNGVYLNPGEFALHDNGFDVAGIGWVANLERTVDTGSLGVFWQGFRSQSKGSKKIDAHFAGTGPTKMGIDLTGLRTDDAGNWIHPAIVVRSNDRIYFDGTPGANPGYYAASTGGSWIGYQSNTKAVVLAVGNTAILQGAADQLAASVPVRFKNVAFAELGPAGVSGRQVFCSDCRKPGEGTGTGTGMMVFDDGKSWVSMAGTIAVK